MPTITDPAQRYFKDGVWGWRPLTDDVKAHWRPLQMLWGYSYRHSATAFGAAVGVGDAHATIDEVGAGEVWVIEAISIIHNAAASKDTTAYIVNGGIDVYILPTADTPEDIWKTWTGRLTLAEGDVIGAFAFAPGAGSKITIHAWGYKMLIAE